jgi:hypothetical protein
LVLAATVTVVAKVPAAQEVVSGKVAMVGFAERVHIDAFETEAETATVPPPKGREVGMAVKLPIEGLAALARAT